MDTPLTVLGTCRSLRKLSINRGLLRAAQQLPRQGDALECFGLLGSPPVIDPNSHSVTHVLLQEGHLWGRKEVAIPISAVTGVDDGIRLSITKQQVQDLPPVDVDHPNA